MTDVGLDGQVAVVTGGGRGIGAAVALGLAEYGSKVVVNDLGADVDGTGTSEQPAHEVVAQIRDRGGTAIASLDSVATSAGAADIVQAALDAYGRVDTLVCAAGILRPSTIFELTEADWDAVLDTNLKGHFTTMQAAARVMWRQRSGTIITFTSGAGLEGNPLQPHYSASKEGIIGLTRAVALGLAPHVTCNAIAPHAKTRMTDRMPSPGRESPGADRVAPLAVFLAGAAARKITGQVIGISGDQVDLYPQPRPQRSARRDGGWTAEALAELWDTALGYDELVRYGRYIDASDRATDAET